MPVPVGTTSDPLTAWLEAPSPPRALILEDGSTGSVSPLARWAEDVVATGSRPVVSASLGPGASLVRERDILVRLFVECFPDDADEPATYSLIELREHVRRGLPGSDPLDAPLVVLDRANWAEASYQRDLGHLLGDLPRHQKVAVSLRSDVGDEPDVAGWLEELGWREEDTLVMRLPAALDGGSPPAERARAWVEASLDARAHGGVHVAGVLDVVAAALRPLSPAEVAAILDLPPSVVDASLTLAPENAVAIDSRGRYAFRQATVGRAWCALRKEATARVHERIVELGEAALRGQMARVPRYAIEYHGSFLGEHAGSEDQVSLVSEAWAKAWSPLDDPLGFEADVARVWLGAEGELLAKVSAPTDERARPIMTIFRCVQVSRSVMSRVPGLQGAGAGMRRAPKSGNTVRERAAALAGLAEELAEPQRTAVRAAVVDALLPASVTVTEADILVQLAKSFEGARRDAIIAKALDTYRTEVGDGASSVWLLRAAPLLGKADRRALCDEVVSGLHDLPSYEVANLRAALDGVPSDVPSELTRAIAALPRPDRLRLECVLAPHLDGDAKQRIIEEILETMEVDPDSADSADVRSVVPILDAPELARMARALIKATYGDALVGVCLRALGVLGHAKEAEQLAGPDIAAMPFDSVLALAASSRDQRPELGEELTRRLSAMDETALGWTIDRDAAELVAVLGSATVVRFARTIGEGEARIVARVALVPFAEEAEKRALVAEAVQAFRHPTGQEELHWRGLLSCWEWMSVPDACNVLVCGSHDSDALGALEELGPLLKHLAGADAPMRIAEQLIEVGRWAP